MTTKIQQFEAAIIRIRDILRRDGITGMDSMKHCTLYMAARYLTAELLKTLKIPERFGWQSLLALSREGLNEGEKTKNRELSRDRIFNNAGADCLVTHFDHLFKTTEFAFRVSARGHSDIMEVFAPINLEDIKMEKDLLGWVYEQHLAKGSSAARDLGQFFTDRFITAYMTALCDPKRRADGSIESICDPTMGTGGFLTSGVHHLTEKHGVTKKEWEKNKDRIHGCDIDRFVGSVASINLFMETQGVVFPNVAYRDSLHSDLTALTYDVILANMPFGVKGLKYADVCQRVKDLKLNGTKSEPLFLQLMMVALAPGGRCAVVVPDGMLVNTSKCHDSTRKYLLDNFELKRVIKMTGKFFMNTGIQPSIMFFENTGKPTTAVEFWSVVKDDKDTVNETMVLSVPRERFDESCLLDVRRYMKSEKPVVNLDGFPMVKLSMVADCKNGKNIPQEKRAELGTFPYYASNGISGFVEQSNFQGSATLLGDQGSLWKSHYVDQNKKFYAGNHTLVMKAKDNTLNIKYLHYYIHLNDLTHYNRSSTLIPELDKVRFYTMEFPLPPRSVQDEIVATLDLIYNTAKSADVMVADLKTQMATIVKVFDNKCADKTTIGTLYDTPKCTKKFNSKDMDNGGDVPFFNGKFNSPVGTHSDYSYDSDTDYFVMIKDGGGDHSSDLVGMGKFFQVTGKCAVTSHNLVLVQKTSNPQLHKFMSFYLRCNGKEIRDKARYSINLGSISVKDVLEFPIPNMSADQLLDANKRLSSLESQLASLESLYKQSEDNARFILESYLNTA